MAKELLPKPGGFGASLARCQGSLCCETSIRQGTMKVMPIKVEPAFKVPRCSTLILRICLCLAMPFFIASCSTATNKQTFPASTALTTFDLGGTTISTTLSSFGPISIQVPDNWIVINQSTSWDGLESAPCSDQYIMVENARPTGAPFTICPLIAMPQPWTVAVLGEANILPTFNMKAITVDQNKTLIGNLSVVVSTFTVPQTSMMVNNSDSMPSVEVIRGYIPKYGITFEFLSAVDVAGLRTPQEIINADPNLKADKAKLTLQYVELKFGMTLGQDMLNSLRVVTK